MSARILVVDDEESVRGVIAALLEQSGYSATLTESAEEAIARLQQDPDYDLVLSDIMMPGTDGLTLLDHICTDYPGMPVVMFSAINDIHVVTNAFRRGAIDYLLKPFERKELESIVMRGIEHGRLRKQNTVYRQNLESIVTSRTGRLRSTMQDLERSYDITLEAMGDALDAMVTWMAELYGTSRAEALALASTCVDLRVTQVANQVWGVHAVLPPGALR